VHAIDSSVVAVVSHGQSSRAERGARERQPDDVDRLELGRGAKKPDGTHVDMNVVTAISAWLIGTMACGAGQTGELAERLVAALERRGELAMAAHDPSDPRRVVAAMRLGRSQLTVVAGIPDDPTLAGSLRERRYADVYRALTRSPLPNEGFVLHDLNGLGLRAQRNAGEAFDMFHPSGGVQVAFDGDWQVQHLTEEEYCSAFRRADARYMEVLTVLLSETHVTR
jgi:hypothetical protein